MSDILKRALVQQLETNAVAYELLGEKELPRLLRRAATSLNRPHGHVLVQAEPRERKVAVSRAVGDLSGYLVAGAAHTLGSISRLDQGPARRKLIATLARQVRSLKRNEDRIRAVKRAEVSGG